MTRQYLGYMAVIIDIAWSVIGTKTKPTLTPTYSVNVECNFQDKQQTIDIKEYYDYPNQRAVVIEHEVGLEAKGIYSYQTNQLFTIEDQLRKCRHTGYLYTMHY
jgi:hypothetical protein